MNVAVDILLCLCVIKWSFAIDTVVSPRPYREWASQTFVIATGKEHSELRSDTGFFCGLYSDYYCLHAYETRDIVDGEPYQDNLGLHWIMEYPDNPDVNPDPDLAYNPVAWDTDFLCRRLETLQGRIYYSCHDPVRAIHGRHNLFSGKTG